MGAESRRGPLDRLRMRLLAEINATVHGRDLHLERYDRPAGDPGLYGPDSVVWRVHGHPAGMVAGGFAALLLQSLHPVAMAAVDAHSDFRVDPTGRLNRTARFVATTTLGSTAAAEAAIAGVRRIHPRIRGTAPDGRAYRADDPDLLTWVHTAEVLCFLTGYQIFSATPLTGAECDRYYAEAARVAERLGATAVPGSRAEVAAYLARIRPELRATPPALEVVRLLRGFGRSRRERAAVRALTNAAIALLPGWARAELGIRRPRLVRALWDRPVARTGGRIMVWACGPSQIRAAAYARATATGTAVGRLEEIG
ncbi:oxygenase MpaB family protein [Streptomyces sp. SP17BM10]|uniref:oxygenase MpaB family protein n=1 Tax=Streptomyces sp. SP17BM10 TaxID=3002530 RepID=UPI002E7A9ED3|nr:oxygenase MpaB family protein [Streptomyces sp. SP17BM10]MEE1786655.1 oxygenase MpaB family protein [Streptomyces sp. SP17BM10]